MTVYRIASKTNIKESVKQMTMIIFKFANFASPIYHLILDLEFPTS